MDGRLTGKENKVDFICTQTDKIEASEIMQEHEDLAKQMNLWQEMESLQEDITKLDVEINNNGSNDVMSPMQTTRTTAQDTLLKKRLAERERRYRQLNTACAAVRNKYSRGRILQDFQDSIMEYLCEDGEEEWEKDATSLANADLMNRQSKILNLEIFCVSSNDYLKLKGIKSTQDGQALAFQKCSDTEIPSVRSFLIAKASENRYVCHLYFSFFQPKAIFFSVLIFLPR